MDTLKKIGKYKYGERHCLGQGSFGKVYEGVDENGRKVAIKKLQQRMIATDPYLKQSLSTQIMIMKRLKHRNIVQLIDTVTTANSIYLILQYCAGGDLKRYSMNKKFSQDQALKILKQLIQGFEVIVSQGIIHRDLKPANVLVHQGTFKICDFGFAKYFGEMNRMAKTCVGTPIYMSPQVLKQKPYTAKSDVWSLGVMYYELLFGKIPYLGKSQDQIFKIITRGKLSIPKCTQQSYLFLKNTLVIDEEQRWDWNKVFSHLGVKQNKQKPGFYQNLVNLFTGNEQSTQKKIIQNHSNSYQNKQKRNNSFKQKVNFKYNNSIDSPQKQQEITPKIKHNRMARNILAQEQTPFNTQQQLPKVIEQPIRNTQQQVRIIEPQKIYYERIYRPQQTQKLRWMYTICTRFILKEPMMNYSVKIHSYQRFLYNIVTFTLGEYIKHLSQGNLRLMSKITRIILSQQRDTLQKLVQEIKRFQRPCDDIRSIASIIDLQGKTVLIHQDSKIVEQLTRFII